MKKAFRDDVKVNVLLFVIIDMTACLVLYAEEGVFFMTSGPALLFPTIDVIGVFSAVR